MKRALTLLLVIFVLSLATTVSAAPRHNDDRHDNHKRHHYDWSHSSYHNKHWERMDHRSDEPMPFKWYERRHNHFPAEHRMERIDDHEWVKRFPGLHSYRWRARQGEEFWYHGHRVTNAVLFYNSSDELVSVGFMHDGVFIFIRDDGSYRNHDSFFLAWKRW